MDSVEIWFESGDAIVGRSNVPAERIRQQLGQEAIVILLDAAILVEDEFVPIAELFASVYLRDAIFVRCTDQRDPPWE